MKGFSYIEHRENVALALDICKHLNIDRQTALQGMYQAIPDEGVLRRYSVEAFQKTMIFYNGFAANDPDSTMMVWEKIKKEMGWDGIRIILLNTRQDRLDRAKQLAEMSAKKMADHIDYLMLIGQSTEVVEAMAVKYGMPRKNNQRWLDNAAKGFEKVLSVTNKSSVTLAIGNMGGMGAITVEYFHNRSIS